MPSFSRGASQAPKNQMQKLENLTVAMEFLESEGIKLISISPDAINKGKLPLIKAMLFSIILRYQIAAFVGGNGKDAKSVLLGVISQQLSS